MVLVEGIRPLSRISGVELLEQARPVFPDTIERRLAMDKLLTRVLDAQRRLNRWFGMQTLTGRSS
jgi:hypothetical protein